MKKILFIALVLASTCSARVKFFSFCEQGGVKVVTNSQPSASTFQQSYPGATVTVYYTGGWSGSVTTNGTAVTFASGEYGFNANSGWVGLTMTINSVPYTISSVNSTTSITLGLSAGTQTNAAATMPSTAPAPVFSDNAGTVKGNPYTCDSTTAQQFVFMDNGTYDFRFSGTGIVSPFTISAISGIDPQSLPNTASDLVCSTVGCLSALCATAATLHQTLLVSRIWDFNGTCAASQYDYSGGGWRPTTGHATILSGAFDGDLTQHFDLSAGGTINLSGAAAAELYPEWFGATCGSADSTAAIQAVFNVLSNAERFFPCYYTTLPVYLPSYQIGLSIRAATVTGAGVTGAPNPIGGLIAKTGATGALLTDYANQISMRNFSVNCRSICATPIELVGALGGHFDNVMTTLGTGDGWKLYNEGSPSTTLTSAITASSMASFTVASAALPGMPLSGSGNVGGNSCALATVDWNTSAQEFISFTVSGNTITPTSSPAHNHSIGAPIQCHGNNDSTYFYGIRASNNAGFCFDIMQGADNNGIHSYGTDCENNNSGEIWSGSVNEHFGGLSQGNNGPPLQLGDVTGGGAVGTNGRATASNVIGPFLDLENTSGNNAVVSACDAQSIVEYREASLFAASAPGGPCPALGAGNSTAGWGYNPNSNSFGTFTVKTLSGSIVLDPSIGGVQTYNPSAVQQASPFYNSVGSTTGITTQNIPPNRVFEASGSANNALVINLLDSTTGLAIPLNATNSGLIIAVDLSHSLRAGGNTIAVNNTAPCTNASPCNIVSHFNYTSNIAAGYSASAIVMLQWNNNAGVFTDMSQ